MRHPRQRARAAFLAFYVLVTKSTVSPADLEKMGITHHTAWNAVKELVDEGCVGGKDSLSFSTFTPETLESLRAFALSNTQVVWSSAWGVVEVLGLDQWSQVMQETFYQRLRECVQEKQRTAAPKEPVGEEEATMGFEEESPH